MPDPTVTALQRALFHATAWVDGLAQRSVAATADLDQLRARLGGELAEHGMEPTRVIDELVARTTGGHLGCASGRFFAWVIGGALPSALAADWLTSAWDQNAAMYACAPAAAVVEEVVGEWLKDLLDLPRQASFALTTGCQLAHVTCLLAARHAVLQQAGWDVGELGLFGAPPVRLLASEHRHGSIDRAARILGFGARSLTALPGVQLVWAPRLNQGLVRFVDPRPHASATDHDARTDAVIAAVNATGEAFFSGTTWQGRRAMRVSVVNWRTTAADVARTLAAVQAVLASPSG